MEKSFFCVLDYEKLYLVFPSCVYHYSWALKNEKVFATLKAGPDLENLLVLKLCSLRRYMRKQLSAKNF